MLSADAVLARLESSDERARRNAAAERRARFGPNSLGVRRVTAAAVFARQLRNPLLILLLAAAAVSGATGDPTDAAIIGAIVALSVGLGFVNEYRAASALSALHRDLHHEALVFRDGVQRTVDVSELVPGDVVVLRLGDIVPADLRVLEASGLECDEAVADRRVAAGRQVRGGDRRAVVAARAALLRVHGHGRAPGTGRGVVVATGTATAFGRIAVGLSEHQAETAFQVGLRRSRGCSCGSRACSRSRSS